MAKWLLLLGALNGAAAVLLGAFGAHALRVRLGEDLLAVYRTASDYHFYHALALIGAGLLARLLPESRLLLASGASLLLGMLLFSGSLYLLAVTNTRWLGAITPFGGLAFVAGWLLLAAAAWQLR